MTITTSDASKEDIYIVLGERFDFGAVEQFRNSYECLGEANFKTLYIDFKNTRYMDSSALGMLLNAKSFFSGSAIKIKLINANDPIKKIFSISRFDTKFEIV